MFSDEEPFLERLVEESSDQRYQRLPNAQSENQSKSGIESS